MIFTTIKNGKQILALLYFLFVLGIASSNGALLFQEKDTGLIKQLNESALSHFQTNIDKAEIFSKKALKLGEELGYEKGKVTSLKLLAQIYDSKKQFDKAAFYYELYSSKNDSIRKIGREKSVALLNAKYDFEVREALIEKEQAVKQKELESIIEQKQVSQSKLMIFFIFIVTSLVILICYVFLLMNRNKALLKQQYEIEKLTEKQRELIEMKTSELLSSNDTISHYAFLNSHELRAPLAKILSIVYLFDQMNVTKDSFSKLLKESAKELEGAVAKIIQELQTNSSEISKDSNN